MLEAVMNTPVYMGGDPTVTSWISADNMTPTKPANSFIEFATGTNDYAYTRQVSIWHDSSFVRVLRKMFNTTITTYDAYVNPYVYENVDINGTDGW